MRSQKELDMENFPFPPHKWEEPITASYIIDWYKDNGWLDKDGKITEKGRKDIDLCDAQMNGTETDEHFQKRLRQYRRRLEFCTRWFREKWGEDGGPIQPDLPFPIEEYNRIDD